MQSHIAMFYGIRKAFPDVNVISEEHGEKTVDLNSVAKLATSNPEVRQVAKWVFNTCVTKLNFAQKEILGSSVWSFRLTVLMVTTFLRTKLRYGSTP